MCVIIGCFTRKKAKKPQSALDKRLALAERGVDKFAEFKVCNQERLNTWQDAIDDLAEVPQVLKAGDVLCELHFEEKLIFRDVSRAYLKPLATPTIFPEAPDLPAPHFPDCAVIKRSMPSRAELEDFFRRYEKENPHSINDSEVVENGHDSYPEDGEKPHATNDSGEEPHTLSNADLGNQFMGKPLLNSNKPEAFGEEQHVSSEYLAVLKNYKWIQSKSLEWDAVVNDDNIEWTTDDEFFKIDKRVVLSSSMEVEVFLQSTKVPSPTPKKVKNSNELLLLLEQVSGIIPCEEAGKADASKHCVGYVLRRSQQMSGPQMRRCLPCKKRRKYILHGYKKVDSLQKMKQKLAKQTNRFKALQCSRKTL